MTPRFLPFLLTVPLALAQDPPGFPGPGFPGPGGPGFPGGPGGPGGPMGQQTKVLERFDLDKNQRLDAEERKAARAWLAENRAQRGRGPGGRGFPGGGPGDFPGGGPGGFPGPGGPGGEGGRQPDPNAKGKAVAPADVPSYPGRPLFDPDVVRTLFVEFPQGDWFEELSAFYHTDVVVPATVTVDGKVYADVGTNFRGNTSYMMARGKKKPWELDFGFGDQKQNLLGVRNLDLINCAADPSFLREVLHGWIANQFFPAPRVALVRLVVNGEDFGVYAAVQQFDKEFLQDHFGTKQGNRWKVPADFSGNGGLRWLGEDPKAYERNYQLKSKEDPVAWAALVDLCAVLANTPLEDLERVLPQHLDVEGTLWFLAVDNALADDDGYFSRASDYVLYRDPNGRFHPIPRDNNEILLGGGGPRGPRPGGPGVPPNAPPGDAGAPRDPQRPGFGPGGQGPGGQGPGGRRGPGGGPGGGTAQTPLQGAARQDRPLLHRLLEVPAWRERYLAHLREIATRVFAPEVVGARIESWRATIAPIVADDVHALYGAEAFERCFLVDDQQLPARGSLLAVIAQRRKAILDDPALAGEWPAASDLTLQAPRVKDGLYVLQVAVRGAGAAAVRLHHDRGAFGSYTAAGMLDDGKHGDGAAKDGVFGCSLPPIEPGAKWRFWVEAVAAGSGHVACLPASGGALPMTWTAPKQTGGR